MIETASDKYFCDDYILYPNFGVQCIVINDSGILGKVKRILGLQDSNSDAFFITAPVVAYHDYSSGISLSKFTEMKIDAIQQSKAKTAETLKHDKDSSDVGFI